MDSWLTARLSGGRRHVTDPTNASRTLLWDLNERRWSPELQSLLGVPTTLLPEVLPSSGEFALTDPDACGLEVPILGIAGDQQAALFGQGCWSAGLAKNTYGTGAFMLLHTGDRPMPSEHGLLTTAACGPKGELAFALEGSIFIAGAAVQWLRDGLGLLENASASEALAQSVAGNDGVYLVPAFVGLGAPHWDPEARGTLVGLTRGTGRAHVVRAALEAMAYGTEEVLRAMEADSGVEARELRVDGGVAANDWLMRFQAGILGIPVRRPPLVETTALGAAGLAGIAAGVWSDADHFSEAFGAPVHFAPELSPAERSDLLTGWRRAVHAARAWSQWSP
jgi:glycerol kinase